MKKEKHKKPRLPFFLLRILLPDRDRNPLYGNFDLYYEDMLREKGRNYAWFRLFGQILKSAPGLLFSNLSGSFTMYRSYLKTAFRNIKRNKSIALINISGLTIGITCFILILLYVQFEFSYDNYHKDSDNIYRVAMIWQSKNVSNYWATISPPAVKALKDNFSVVEYAASVRNLGRQPVRLDDKMFYEDFCLYADPQIFKILTFKFINGSPETALNRPGTVVLSKSMVQKYFGNKNPIGKSIYIGDNSFEITAVIDNYPENTHLKYNCILSLLTDKSWKDNTWGNIIYHTYIKLAPNVDLKSFEKSVNEMEGREYKELLDTRNQKHIYFLQPLKDIHLSSNMRREFEAPGNLINLYIFLAIAVFVLLIACMNFTILAVARSSKRAKEVGMRKVVGAGRLQLINQFITESFIVAGISIIAAIILAVIFLPYFNSLSGKNFNLENLFNPQKFYACTVVLFFVAAASGSYPAFFLSALKPVKIIKGILNYGNRRFYLRKFLVIGQYMISICMIICTIVVYNQVNFMKNQYPGFNKEHKLILNVRGKNLNDRNCETVKNEFLKYSSITGVTASSNVPGRRGDITGVMLFGDDIQNDHRFYYYYVDYEFLSEYDFKIIAGRAFDFEKVTDASSAVIINESALKVFGWTSPEEAIGKQIIAKVKAEIIGVVEDFHFNGFKETIEPFFFRIYPRYRYLSLTVKPGNIGETIDFIKSKWKNIFPGIPCDYFFLDEDFDILYKSEAKAADIFRVFTILALFIACLGLFGLISFISERRAKEVGIRRVFGASVIKNVILLNYELIRLITLANIFSWPIAYFLMSKWLGNFAYRININILIFFISGLLSLTIAFFTTSFQTIRTAQKNPIESLRNE
ncbi:ABC transporter permease [candidate division KSB1 bacterium]